jgi:RNA polymerase sigma-70 factor (ECF subfamily)
MMCRIRDGDQEAATELVRHYEPTIRRVIRFRLRDTHLKTVLDSMDVCQSVMCSFFLRAAAGQYELEQPEQLVQLLVTMARNKLASRARLELAQRRDRRRVTAAGDQAEQLAAHTETPSQVLVARELLEETYRRLAPEELELVRLRHDGLSWDEIAARLGETSQNLRKRFSRALNRVARELGVDEVNDE